MLHAAAMLAGLFLLELIATQYSPSPYRFVIAVIVALMCVAAAARFGGVGRNAFSYAPQFLRLVLARSGAVVRGSLSVIRAATAADVTVKPALVRIKARSGDPFSAAAVADLISAVPGMIVVEADADGLLVHVMNEDAVDAADLGALEVSVLASLGVKVGT
jgi:multisubunit Na+/H+ antiporter MnhE subunit